MICSPPDRRTHVAMMFDSPTLRVVLATVHIPWRMSRAR
jgi:4-hydroxy-L-threonine phosphate dehydrogenase PdxA